jgi:hypothetical protein
MVQHLIPIIPLMSTFFAYYRYMRKLPFMPRKETEIQIPALQCMRGDEWDGD